MAEKKTMKCCVCGNTSAEWQYIPPGGTAPSCFCNRCLFSAGRGGSPRGSQVEVRLGEGPGPASKEERYRRPSSNEAARSTDIAQAFAVLGMVAADLADQGEHRKAEAVQHLAVQLGRWL